MNKEKSSFQRTIVLMNVSGYPYNNSWKIARISVIINPISFSIPNAKTIVLSEIEGTAIVLKKLVNRYDMEGT